MSILKSLTHSFGSLFKSVLGTAQTDVVSILKVSSAHIDQIESCIAEKTADAMRHEEDAAYHKLAAEYHSAEADKARAVSSNLKIISEASKASAIVTTAINTVV